MTTGRINQVARDEGSEASGDNRQGTGETHSQRDPRPAFDTRPRAKRNPTGHARRRPSELAGGATTDDARHPREGSDRATPARHRTNPRDGLTPTHGKVLTAELNPAPPSRGKDECRRVQRSKRPLKKRHQRSDAEAHRREMAGNVELERDTHKPKPTLRRHYEPAVRPQERATRLPPQARKERYHPIERDAGKPHEWSGAQRETVPSSRRVASRRARPNWSERPRFKSFSGTEKGARERTTRSGWRTGARRRRTWLRTHASRCQGGQDCQPRPVSRPELSAAAGDRPQATGRSGAKSPRERRLIRKNQLPAALITVLLCQPVARPQAVF